MDAVGKDSGGINGVGWQKRIQTKINMTVYMPCFLFTQKDLRQMVSLENPNDDSELVLNDQNQS